jgi:hypothetical protein
MTKRKHFKQLVRSRMEKTGEGYTTARRHVIQKAQPSESQIPSHFAGHVPATAALRVLLTHAGVRAPHTKQPFSEAMLFGIAGGVGIGICSFFYEKANTATFFIAGRHLWQDDLAYLRQVCGRFDARPVVHETTGARAAEQALRDALEEYGPCVAWVDFAHLPHRAMPAVWSGGCYHVVTVYRIDAAAGTALVGDLTDEPVAVPLADLAAARARIKKQKHRLLSLPPSSRTPDLPALVRDGLRACHHGLTGGTGWKNCRTPFSLEAVRLWGEHLYGSKAKERWERVFAPGLPLWRGLVSVYDFIEHFGTGGGLCRPLFADFLTEAAGALRDPALRGLAARYAELGRGWSALADAALPDDVPAFREAKALCARKAELTRRGGSPDEVRAAWDRLGELERRAASRFPLPDGRCAELRASLQARVLALYEGEVAAHTALGEAVA